jgi:hypothetical protein
MKQDVFAAPRDVRDDRVTKQRREIFGRMRGRETFAQKLGGDDAAACDECVQCACDEFDFREVRA